MTAPPSKELGETQDAKELVPGSVATITASVSALEAEATKIDGVRADVEKIVIDTWVDGYSRQAYTYAHRVQLPKFAAYSTLLTTAGKALSTYAGSLSTAQTHAGTAIATWAEGEAATAKAVTAYNDEVEVYNASLRQPRSPSPYGSAGTTLPRASPPGPFVDPGVALRKEAEDILEDARKDLDKAGQQAVEALGGLEGSKTQGTSEGPGVDGEVKGPSFSWDWWSKTFGKEPTKGKNGKYDDKHRGGDFTISLGEAEGAAWVWRGQGSVEDYWGPVLMHADGSITTLGVDGSAAFVIDKEGLHTNASATAALAKGEGSVGGEYGYGSAQLKGDFLVGADADGHASATTNGGHAGGELFAGAKAGVTAEGELGGVGGGVTAEGWAGAGIAGDVDMGWDSGKLTVGGSGGVAWGIGGKVGGEVTLDLPKLYDTGKDVADDIEGWFQ